MLCLAFVLLQLLSVEHDFKFHWYYPVVKVRLIFYSTFLNVFFSHSVNDFSLHLQLRECISPWSNLSFTDSCISLLTFCWDGSSVDVQHWSQVGAVSF